MYSGATAVLLGVFCVLLLLDLLLNRESRIDFVVTFVLAIAIALVAVACLFMGDRLGPVPALVLVLAHAVLAILFLTVLETPQSAVGVMLQMPVLALYLGAFLSPGLARTTQAIVLLAFGATVIWDPYDALGEISEGRNLPNLLLFSWLCLEAGIFVQRRFRKTTHIDELTGLHNRRGLIDRGDAERARADRLRRPLVVAVADLDGFKEINDTLGHATGDRVLRDLVNQWRSRLRESDFVSRVGGDEFVFLLPDTDLEGARRLLDRLTESPVHPWSWGAVEWRSGDLISIAIAGADEEMYHAKMHRKGTGAAPVDQAST
jgi:GGDEF domain-containing protein